jgi:hypothetical protein
MDLKYSIILYLFIVGIIYLLKPHIFKLNKMNKKRKMLYLISLMVIIAIISFYIKILFEWFY